MRDRILTAPAGVVAVVRAPTAREALTIGLGLARGGVGTIEITLTVPGAVAVIAELSRDPAVLVGAGTVLDAAAVAAVAAAGAAFVVAPDTDPLVVAAARAHGLPVVPGALTPTEIRRAWALGADAVKVFPVGSVGGPGYVRAVREPLPDVPLVVSGGIALTAVGDYLAAGVRAVCLGSALIDRAAAAAGDTDAVADHARAALAQLVLPVPP